MATALLLRRRQFSPTSNAIAAIATLFHTPSTYLPPSKTTKNGGIPIPPPLNPPYFERFSTIHTRSWRFDFLASFTSQATGFAFSDYADEEKARAVGGDNELEISKINVHLKIVSALAKKGITKLFPIQKAVLEPAMRGRDMIGRAKTGTGKTLAFGIPIMDKIIRYNEQLGCGRNPMALVLAPTRELAKQVEKEFYEYSNLDTLCVYGGTPISRQMSILNRGVDIVVGTPGRVIDLLKRGALDLSEVQFVVLDEADQMLNVGFEEDVEVILEKLPQNRQTMMFSATMPNWILKLTRKYLKDPVIIDLVGDSDQKLAEGILLYTVVVEHFSKAGVIGPLVTEHANGGKCIVFTQTKRDSDNLAYALGRNNYRCEPLHGDIPQGLRERTLKRFRDGDINILVATDVAARGLDIPNVDLVIHYEHPTTSEIFVHRSGRTGRAGKKGTAILISTMDQSRAVRVIERDVGCRFKELPPVPVDGVEMEMPGRIGAAGRFGSGGRFGNSGFSRSGGYGNSNPRRYGDFGDPDRSGGFNYGRSGGFGESGSGRFGAGGSPRSSGGLDGFNNDGRSGFGRSRGQFSDGGRSDSSGFGNFGSGRRSGFGDASSRSGFGRSRGGFSDEGRTDSSDFGNFGSGRRSGFGDARPSQNSGGIGGARFGSFRDDRS